MAQGISSYNPNELSPEYHAQRRLQADSCGSRSGDASVHSHISDSQHPWDPFGSNSRPDPRVVSYLYEQAIDQRNFRKTRRRLNSEERKRCALVRRIGACKKCRKGKRKCTHVAVNSRAGGIDINGADRSPNLRPQGIGNGGEPASENHRTLPGYPASMAGAERFPIEHGNGSFSPSRIARRSRSVCSSPHLPSLPYGSYSESREQEVSWARGQGLGAIGGHEIHDPVDFTGQQETPTAWSLDDICRYAWEGQSGLMQDLSFPALNSSDAVSSLAGYESGDSVFAISDIERWAAHENAGEHSNSLERVETKWYNV